MYVMYEGQESGKAVLVNFANWTLFTTDKQYVCHINTT